MSDARTDVKNRIETIEQSYEFFLAYAAQGLSTDQGAKVGSQLRDFLRKMERALDGLRDAVHQALSNGGGAAGSDWSEMLEVLDADARATLAAIRLVSAREGVSSQLIDNLNANIHLRALLTDLFLVDDLI
ncbi:MAG TPA: hypothetical protein VFQ22_07645 [Longimicrobiales bacterium]|nr:hypothetical protein [Longimicrobiales bacterium]